jgi:hypothetical protein
MLPFSALTGRVFFEGRQSVDRAPLTPYLVPRSERGHSVSHARVHVVALCRLWIRWAQTPSRRFFLCVLSLPLHFVCGVLALARFFLWRLLYGLAHQRCTNRNAWRELVILCACVQRGCVSNKQLSARHGRPPPLSTHAPPLLTVPGGNHATPPHAEKTPGTCRPHHTQPPKPLWLLLPTNQSLFFCAIDISS